MSNSIVAIIGRQNTGKSTLLNRLAGRQLAITADLPGTTRDRIFATISWRGVRFSVVDSGGLVPSPQTTMAQEVNAQVSEAIAEADIIIFLVDIKDGITPVDQEIAARLRKVSKPLIVVANKADNAKLEGQVVELFELGLGEPLAISAYHSRGIDELLDRTVTLLPPAAAEAEAEAIKAAIIGRTNVGKSTLLNTLLGEERAIVDEKPGTTRDATDTPLDFGGQSMILIDTAGIRRRGRIERGVEQYSVIRTLRAIDRADVALLVLDAAEMVTAQDTHIAGLIRQAVKGIILIVNKWDMVKEPDKTEFSNIIKSRLKFVPYAPVLYASAKSGQGVDMILPEASRVYRERGKRIATAEVNSMLKEALAAHRPPARGRRQLKILYATQAEVNPPTFVFFVNDTGLMHFSYQRYLENKLRSSFGFAGTPLRMVFKARGEQ